MGEESEQEIQDGTVEQTGTDDEGKKTPGAREQVPTHVPPHLRDMFTKHEGSVAARPGFRNPANAKAKAQRKKKKKGKR